MKKTYITPELEETLVQSGHVLTIIPTSPTDSGNYAEDNPLVVDSKKFNEYSLEGQYIWE